MKITGWKKNFPGAHIEQMRSDFEHNEKYCSKEGQLIEHGQRPRQGECTDLQELKVQLDAGRRPLEIHFPRIMCAPIVPPITVIVLHRKFDYFFVFLEFFFYFFLLPFFCFPFQK
jgi:hypothetical protein